MLAKKVSEQHLKSDNISEQFRERQIRAVPRKDSNSESKKKGKIFKKSDRHRGRAVLKMSSSSVSVSQEKQQDPAVALQATTPSRERLHLLL